MTSNRHNRTADDTVLDAARDCVLAVGVRRTTLSSVARTAGVSRMTLYRRFPDVSNLLATLMTREFVSVSTDTRLQRVLQLMVNHRIRSMPVVDDDGRPIGMIAREDVMRALDRCAAS